MSTVRPNSPLVFFAPLLVGVVGLALIVLGSRSGNAGEVLTAQSVCEAQELKARKQMNPELQIEIPPEFNTPWPSREACLSLAGASDPETPGPLQPIPFSHKHHAGLYQIECMYCHSGTDRAPSAGMPSVELCMGCHSQFPTSYDEMEGIRTLKGLWESKQPAQWVQIYRLPEHVQFRHNRHVQAGVECQRCHGAVEEMDKVYMTPDTVWWPWLLPSTKPEMGWCIQCHRANEASQDCLTCHY